MKTSPRTFLVTGAAGLIGGEVCARAAAAGHRVHALVRRTRDVRGNDGAPVPVASVMVGDVTRDGLIAESTLDEPVDCVIHCAAALEFDAPRSTLDPVNVYGTANAARFAARRGARLLHVSTAYVCGTRAGVIAEGPVAPGTCCANNYEASKAAAEAVVEAGAVDWTIARPSIVLGDSADGTIRDFPGLCMIFRLMAQGAMPVLPAAPDAALDLVPIDHVARGILALAEAGERASNAHVHIVSGAPLPARALADAVRAVDHFPDPQVVDPAAFDPAALTPAQRRIGARMLATYGGYLTRAPRFADARLRALTGLVCPDTDHAWLQRLVGYGLARGYLPQRTSG